MSDYQISSKVHQLLLFSCWVVSDSLWPHGLQHVRLPCPSLFPGVCSNSCLLNRWCHPTISSSATLFFCLQPVSESGSFPMSQYFLSAGQIIGTSGLESVLPWIFKVDLFRTDCFDIFAVQGTLKSLFHTTVQKHQFFGIQLSLWSNSHIHIWLQKKNSFD